MPSETISIAEATERLGSLDMANPSFDQSAVEQHFERFLYNIIAPTSLPIIWLKGVHDHRNTLLDMDIFGLSTNNDFNNAVNYRIGDLMRILKRDIPELRLHSSVYRNLLLAIAPQLTWRFELLFDSDLLRAFEAGLGYFAVNRKAIILFPRPGLRTRVEMAPSRINGNVRVLHSGIGPAVQFPEDSLSNQHWVRGVRVQSFVVEHPERITNAHIRAAGTRQLRRTLIDQYGLLRYCKDRKFQVLDKSEKYGAILYAKGGKSTSWGGTTHRECVIELINSTPEPDGTHRHFARRVPGTMTTAHEAVAWTFGFNNSRDYHPDVQT